MAASPWACPAPGRGPAQGAGVLIRWILRRGGPGGRVDAAILRAPARRRPRGDVAPGLADACRRGAEHGAVPGGGAQVLSLRGGPARIRSERDPLPEAPPTSKPRLTRALADLWGLIMRSQAPQLRLRAASALVLTLAGKGLGVWAPLLIGQAISSLAHGRGAGESLGLSFAGLALGWALLRFLSSAAPQARDAVFTVVSQAAQRRAATEAFGHALSLSMDYHQTKRSGALARTVDRGARSIEYLIRTLAFNMAPTMFELLLAAAVLQHVYDWRYAAVVVLTVVVYAA